MEDVVLVVVLVEGELASIVGVDLPEDVPQTDDALHHADEAQPSLGRVLRDLQGRVQHLQLGLVELLLEGRGLVDLGRGLDHELDDLARVLVLRLLGVRRGAEGVLGSLVAEVAVAPIPVDLVQQQEEVDAYCLDVGARVRRSTSEVRQLDAELRQHRLEDGEEDLAGLPRLLSGSRRSVVLHLSQNVRGGGGAQKQVDTSSSRRKKCDMC